MTLDKPFLFFIQENHSGAILFMGKLGNPELL
jgi:serpin B